MQKPFLNNIIKNNPLKLNLKIISNFLLIKKKLNIGRRYKIPTNGCNVSLLPLYKRKCFKKLKLLMKN